jgi:hypothetical protein
VPEAAALEPLAVVELEAEVLPEEAARGVRIPQRATAASLSAAPGPLSRYGFVVMKSLAIAIGLFLAAAPARTLGGGRSGSQPPPPVVESVEPASGSAGGGTTITVTGSFFRAGAMVTLGKADATDVVVVSSSRITAVTRPHPPGAVVVTVMTRDGRSGTQKQAFTYVAEPGSAASAGR